MRKTIIEHKRIIFNGNNYSDEWVAEAEKRGLLNLKTTADALPCFVEKKNVELFVKHKVFFDEEVKARYEILLENYSKVLNIEALTMLDIARKEIIPAVSSYIRNLSETAIAKKQLITDADCEVETALVSKLSTLSSVMFRKIDSLNDALRAKNYTDLKVADSIRIRF